MRSLEHRTRLTVGEFTVTVLERTEIRHSENGKGFVVLARREPHEVVVEGRNGPQKTDRLEHASSDSKVRGSRGGDAERHRRSFEILREMLRSWSLPRSEAE